MVARAFGRDARSREQAAGGAPLTASFITRGAAERVSDEGGGD